MKRFFVPILLAAWPLALHAQDKAVPRVETKAPPFRETAPTAKTDLPLTLRDAVDALPPADLKEFLNVLRDHYIGAEKLTDAEISRATVQGLLERIAPGASLLPPPTQTP